MYKEPLMRLIELAGTNRSARWCFCGGVVLISLGAAWSWRISHSAVQLSADAVIRCHASLPVVVGGWNTVLAECDGQAVAIGPASQIAAAEPTRSPMMNSDEYARDMQAMRDVLSSRPPPVPEWVPMIATLLGLALIGGLLHLFRGLPGVLSNLKGLGWRRPRPAAQAFAQNSGDYSSDALTVAMHRPIR